MANSDEDLLEGLSGYRLVPTRESNSSVEKVFRLQTIGGGCARGDVFPRQAGGDVGARGHSGQMRQAEPCPTSEWRPREEPAGG